MEDEAGYTDIYDLKQAPIWNNFGYTNLSDIAAADEGLSCTTFTQEMGRIKAETVETVNA